MYDDYYEPTEEEQLEAAIEDDAYDPEDQWLLRRQQERWQVFTDRVEQRNRQLEEGFDKPVATRVAQWWELHCMYPRTIEQIFAPHWEVQHDTVQDIQDVHSWGNDIVRTFRDYTIWFKVRATSPAAEHWIHQHFSGPNLGQYKVGSAMLVEPTAMRIRIFSYALHGLGGRDFNEPPNRYALMAPEPPPVAGSGVWLPSLQGYADGARA